MKTPSEYEVRLKDIFNEEELMKFQSSSLKIDEASNSLFFDDKVGKNDLKSLIFKICRSKIKDSYLLTALSWLEEESRIKTKEEECKELTKVKYQNEFLKTSLNWINDNCLIKLNSNAMAQYPNLSSKEISVPFIKSYLKSQNKIKEDESVAVKPDKFITFSEESISKIETPDFNIFKLEEEVGPENTLSVVGCYIFTSYGLYSYVKYNKFEKFIQEITKGYIRANPYHNVINILYFIYRISMQQM